MATTALAHPLTAQLLGQKGGNSKTTKTRKQSKKRRKETRKQENENETGKFEEGI